MINIRDLHVALSFFGQVRGILVLQVDHSAHIPTVKRALRTILGEPSYNISQNRLRYDTGDIVVISVHSKSDMIRYKGEQLFYIGTEIDFKEEYIEWDELNNTL